MSRKQLITIAVTGCLFLTAAVEAAETIHFREGGGAGYTDVLFDDTWIDTEDDDTHGNDGYNGIKAGDTPNEIALLAVKDLFTELPLTSGGCDIQINSATLHLFRYQGNSSDVVRIYRMTTDWLPDDAGSNENDVSGEHAEKSSTTTWASGDFSSSDYDSTPCDTSSWVSDYNEECELDITDVIAEIYDVEVNYGICIRSAGGGIQARASEYTQAYRPSLEINYEYVGGATYTLTVNSGTGDGSYSEGATPTITADAAPSGQEFDEWIGDTSGIASVTSSSTTLTMPAANQEVTATYADKTWTLTVNSGTGDGSYVVATEILISADTAPSGQEFAEWVGDTEGIASVTSSSTTLTMPYANAEVTATYTDKVWTLTVNSGTGDGSYSVDTVVPIAADTAPSGQEFAEWIGDTDGIASVTSSSTNLTMPYGNAEVTATYADKTWTLTVNSGTGDGSYVVGTIQDITADTAPSGQEFDEWTGDTAGIADVNDPTTTITMPYANAEITATYADKTWTLTVNSGTGDGSYVVGAIADIDADAAPSGQIFDEWVGDTEGIASVTTADTTLTMPYADAEITATYTDTGATYTLTVNSGSGDGDYSASTEVDITADAAASGKFFDRWVGDTTGIADINDPSTTLTMPAADAEITAVYSHIVSGLVSRYTFDMDARDTYGTNDGTLTGGASVTNDSIRGKVLSLDGTDDYVSLPSTAMAAGRSEVTLTLWVKPDEWVSSNTIYDEYAETEYWQFTVRQDEFMTRDSSTGTMGSRDNDVIMPTVPTGQWHHLAFVYSVSEGTKTIYYDGVADTSTSTSIDTLTSTRDGAAIGYACDGDYYDGLIDDVRIYSRALTETEISFIADNPQFTLTVNSGTGDGNYGYDQVIDVAADTAPSGYEFDEWTGDTASIADVSDPTTTYTMPAHDCEITATYEAISSYTLTVNSGSGDGSYAISTEVDITADTAPSGMFFDKWVGDTSGIADINDPSTTLTMPASNAEITAVYAYVASGLVSRYTFDIDARDTYGTNDGTLTGGASVTTDGTRGKVLSLDGTDDYVSLPSSAMAAGRSEVTLSMWINPDEWITSNTIYDEYAETNYWQFTIRQDEFMTRDSSTGTTGSRDNDLTMPSVSTGTWHHLAVVYSVSAGKKEIWYDGAISDTSDTSIDTLTSDRDGAGIGYACDGDYYDGLIDDVRLYSRALNSTEIALLAETSLYALTVNSGTGDGEYVEDQVVNISADTPASGKQFDQWIGDTSGIANVNASSTTLTMPASAQEITATYEDIVSYTLTVNSGSGDGSYTPDTIVDIQADAPASGYDFDEWVGDTSTIADVNAASTTLTMPSANAEITATYASGYTLTVNSGSGDGVYASGTIVDIVANSPPSGQVFDDWIGDTSGINDVNDPTTTLTMPSSDQEVTATYQAATLYTLTVNSGSGDGNYQEGWVVNISADSPPEGKAFDDWVGDTSGIANVNAASTTLTMPGSNAEVTATYEDIGSAPSISGVSGSITQGSTITISGSNFGTGPSGVVFDDFELGTDGNSIMTGSGSARVGQWDSTSHSNYYTNDHKMSGNLAFEADMGVHYLNYVRRNFPAGTSEVFACWWVRIPDPMPGEGNPYEINWKHIWFQGATASDDDLYFIYFHDLPSTIAHIGGNCGVTDGWMWSYGTWHKEDWIRGWIYVKGGITDGHFDVDMLHENGNRGSWSVDGQTWGSTPTPYQYESVRFNAYGRQTTGSYPVHDDCYSAYGPNCRARVEIGNNSDYDSCTDLAIQGPTSWSSSSITAKCNIGGLGSGDWYLFVINGSNVKSTGYKVN